MLFNISANLLDACVLGILTKNDTYGYDLTQKIKNTMNVSESTLYPVFRRLLKEEFLRCYDMEYSGRNRRYYSITENGKVKLEQYQTEWVKYNKLIDSLLCGDI